MTRLCELHLKERHHDAAWQDYEDFLNSGGKILPAATWLELCRAAEGQQMFERALAEYAKLAAAYPGERHAVMAQVGAGRLCLARLNRPQDALRCFEAAAASPVPHLDLESNIEIGIREAKAAMSPGGSPATAAARA
jgi:tetratricopeptide (TPR) repeat protein